MLCALLLRSSNAGGLLFWSVAGLCAGLYLFVHGFILLQRRRLILDTPFSKIRSASLGMVEVSGLAIGPYTVVAPITARPSYYYRTLVWEWKQCGKSKAWVKVAGECFHVPFFLDDNTGRVLIDPRGAELDIHKDFEQEFCDSFFTTKEAAPDNVRGFLARYGIATSNKIKVEEYCIKPKNALFVLGTLAENPGLELSPRPIREPVDISSVRTLSLNVGSTFSVFSNNTTPERDTDSFMQRLAVQAQPTPADSRKLHIVYLSPTTAAGTAAVTQQQKIAAALLKAGISNPAAWSAAGLSGPVAQLDQEVDAKQLDPSALDGSDCDGSNPSLTNTLAPQLASSDPRPAVVLMKGSKSTTFLISWRGQQAVASVLRWQSSLMVWGGPALALLSLYVLLNLVHLL
jgi:E3 ubiquitin ligase